MQYLTDLLSASVCNHISCLSTHEIPVCPFSFCDFQDITVFFAHIFCEFCEFLSCLKLRNLAERELQLDVSYFLCRSSTLGFVFVLFCFFIYEVVIFSVKNSLNFLHLHQLAGKIGIYFSENFKIWTSDIYYGKSTTFITWHSIQNASWFLIF